MFVFATLFAVIAGLAAALYLLARRGLRGASVVEAVQAVVEQAPREPDPARVAMVKALESAGYFAHLAPDEAEGHRADLLDGCNPWNPDYGRVYLYDEEELGECGPRDLFEEARPFLERQGVRLHVIQQKAVVGLQVELTIDGRLEVLLEPGETDTLEEAAALVTKRTFRLLNRLLEQAGSAERAYRLRQDFNATVVFLTPEMRRAIDELGQWADEERVEVG